MGLGDIMLIRSSTSRHAKVCSECVGAAIISISGPQYSALETLSIENILSSSIEHGGRSVIAIALLKLAVRINVR